MDAPQPAAQVRPGSLPEWVKPVALVAMTADHVNTILLDRALPALWAMGRTAFPLFALLAAWNLAFRSRSPRRYIVRLCLWAAVATPIYLATFGYPSLRLNPLFTLGLGVLAGWACLERPAVRIPVLAALVLNAALEHWMNIWMLSFGTTGAILVVALALWLREHSVPAAGLAIVSAALLNLELGSPMRTISGAAICLATLSISLWAARRHGPSKRTVPPGWLRRHGFYLYYPAHLLALLLIWNWLNYW